MGIVLATLILMNTTSDPAPVCSGTQAPPAPGGSCPGAPTPLSHPRPAAPTLVRPPSDPKEYQAASERIRKAPLGDLFAFANYGDVKPQEDLGQSAKLGDAKVRMASLFVPDPVEVVSEYYQNSLAERGVFYERGLLQKDVAMVAFRDPADGFMRTLTLIQQGRGTVVLAAIGDPRKVVASKGKTLPADWPMPPVKGEPIDAEFTEGAVVQTTRSAVLAAPDPVEVMKFYLKELAALGWKPEPGSVHDEGGIQQGSFLRKNQRCAISVIAAALGTSSLYVNCWERRSP